MAEKIHLDPDLSPQDIMERYGVSRATAFRARKRGYVTVNYHKQAGQSHARASTSRRFQELIAIDELNLAGFNSMKQHRFYDLKKGDTKLYSAEWQAFRREILQIRQKLERFLEAPSKDNLMAIIKDPRVHQHLLFEQQQKMLYRLAKNMRVYEEELEGARRKVEELLSQLEV